MEKIIDYFYLIKKKFDKSPYIQAIRQSFILLFPILVIGSIALLLLSFPIEAVRNFIENSLDGFLSSILQIIYFVTFGMFSLYLVVVIAYKTHRVISDRKNIIIFACINSLLCYFILVGPKVLLLKEVSIFDYTNMSNVFTAFLSSLVSTIIYHWFTEKFVKIERRQYAATFKNGLDSILPISVCCLVFGIISIFLYKNVHGTNFNDLIIAGLSSMFTKIGSTYLGGLLVNFFSSVFWFFGIHGNSVFEQVYRSVFLFEEGKIVSKYLFDCYSFIGGGGGTLALLIAILIFSKSKRKKKVATFSGITMPFNINETLVYGIPVVLNPIYVIPFILVPIVNYTISYIAISTGIAPEIIGGVQWTTPVLISGYLATGSIGGSILQLVCLAVGVAIYTPFVILDDRISERSNSEMNKELEKYMRSCEDAYIEPNILDKNNYISLHAEDVAVKLEDDINEGRINLYYQPQVRDGKIVSVEALLRFSYHTLKYLYPPLVIELAKERQVFDELSKGIVIKAIKDFKEMLSINPKLKISVNLDLELLSDKEFVGWLIETVIKSDIPFRQFGIEITENSKFYSKEDLDSIFTILHNNGIEIYMDDFSMGHTAIIYLQYNLFDYVKLDGSLVKNIDNERSIQIIESIINLGKNLGFEVVAEYVENENQRDKLKEMGCDIYQGYLYYRPLSKDDLLQKMMDQIAYKK